MAQTHDGACIEFVESVQPPIPREQKWVLIVSTLKGCPVQCPICDAGGDYQGKLSKEEIHDQIQYLVSRRYAHGALPPALTKIQFARMGDPAFNMAVIQVLEELPARYAMNIMPSISTVAPKNCRKFVDALKRVKDTHYGNGLFQMQFSLHTTSDVQRRKLIPAATLPLTEISTLGESFYQVGDRKITLNFAAVNGFEVDPQVIARHFNPEKFIIKLTPVNPTFASAASNLESVLTDDPQSAASLRMGFEAEGFDVIVSIGETLENQIGSNCGMYVAKTQL